MAEGKGAITLNGFCRRVIDATVRDRSWREGQFTLTTMFVEILQLGHEDQPIVELMNEQHLRLKQHVVNELGTAVSSAEFFSIELGARAHLCLRDL